MVGVEVVLLGRIGYLNDGGERDLVWGFRPRDLLLYLSRLWTPDVLGEETGGIEGKRKKEGMNRCEREVKGEEKMATNRASMSYTQKEKEIRMGLNIFSTTL